MVPYRPPSDILNEVTPLFIDGKSVSEVAQLTKLSEEKVSEIFQGIMSGEYNDVLSYHLVASFNKDGSDALDNADLFNKIKLIIDRGVNSHDAFEFIIDLTDFYSSIGLEPSIILKGFETYCKVPLDIIGSNGMLDGMLMITTMYEKLRKEEETRGSLVENYRSLNSRKDLNSDTSKEGASLGYL